MASPILLVHDGAVRKTLGRISIDLPHDDLLLFVNRECRLAAACPSAGAVVAANFTLTVDGIIYDFVCPHEAVGQKEDVRTDSEQDEGCPSASVVAGGHN